MRLAALTGRVLRDGLRTGNRVESLDTHIQSAMEWLCVAQDSQKDGGVSLRYSLVKGWDKSYPETTGYIIPTFFRYGESQKQPEYTRRAIRMAEWELSIQNRDGSYNGGAVGSGYGSFVFDTGQVIFGLLAAHEATGDQKYIEGAISAARWLASVQDQDGAWRKFTFHDIPHVYYTRVAWALAELGMHTNDRSFTNAAIRNVDWSLRQQKENGWFEQAGFTPYGHVAPYTHTIAYTIEGILETGICLSSGRYIDAAKRSTTVLADLVGESGYLSGTYDKEWQATAGYSCLTGNAQIALIFLRLYSTEKSNRLLEAARRLNRFLCQSQDTSNAPESYGAISGSYPIWGGYQRFAYPNWAAKFFVDSLVLEKQVTDRLRAQQ